LERERMGYLDKSLPVGTEKAEKYGPRSGGWGSPRQGGGGWPGDGIMKWWSSVEDNQ